jgi:hypothetical protein
MPVTQSNYSERGGGNRGIVVLCPNLVGDRLVYFDYNTDRRTWVIRDFIVGQRLDNEHSTLTVEQIEADATYDEFPPWCNAEKNPAVWRTYLPLRATALFKRGQARSLDAPNPQSGGWETI